jgi:hypothetical protein
LSPEPLESRRVSNNHEYIKDRSEKHEYIERPQATEDFEPLARITSASDAAPQIDPKPGSAGLDPMVILRVRSGNEAGPLSFSSQFFDCSSEDARAPQADR